MADSRCVFRSGFEFGNGFTVNAYLDEETPTHDKYAIQVDLTPGGGPTSVMSYLSPQDARRLAADLVAGADAHDAARAHRARRRSS